MKKAPKEEGLVRRWEECTFKAAAERKKYTFLLVCAGKKLRVDASLDNFGCKSGHRGKTEWHRARQLLELVQFRSFLALNH